MQLWRPTPASDPPDSGTLGSHMGLQTRELYRSQNGDCWYLCRDPDGARVFIRHQANLPSGGLVSDLEIGAFLSRGALNPEHQALLELIGTLLPERTSR
jgi:hypothetical protein